MVVLVGCSDDKATTTTTAAAAGTTAPGATDGGTGGDGLDCGLANGQPATGDPIKIGAVVGATGPADFSSAAQGAQAYFNCVNANGGINGRPIQYLVEDDGWDPEKAVTVAKKLVEDEGVVGMVGSTSFVECAANSDYYATQGVAVIAGVGVPRECFFSSNIAPVNQGPRLSGIGAAEYAREQGAKTMACIANVIPNFGGWVCQGLEAWGAENGVTVQSFNGQPDLSDAETIMQQALATNPDAIVVVEAGPGVTGYLKVAEQLGATVDFYGPTSAYDSAFPAAVGEHWFGRFPAEIEFNTMDSTGPDNVLWQAVMAEYGASDAPIDSFSQGGFLSAKIAVDALLGLDTVDRASVTAAFIAVADYESDLVCSPWSFGEGDHHNANHTGRIVELNAEGGWTVVKECFDIPDPEIADLVG
ncbi:MAG: ABC transporter substrate-binding protein [Actinomycetota bacterium]|nr:ABC transporter substrate-binding protein [Actinomycetota bacterium]